MSQLSLQLSQQVVFAGFLLLAHLLFDDAPQVGHSLLIVARVDVIVGIGIVPLFLSPPMDGIARHVANHVFGVVNPVLLDVAFGKPGACTTIDGRLRLVKATHVGESGGSIVESTFVELRASHEHPSLPEEWVVFLATQPLQVAFRLAAFLCPFGSLLDAVQLDGLLTFLDGFVEVALSDFLAILVAYGVEG